MKIYQEIHLSEFEPWAGAKALFNKLTEEEMDILNDAIEEMQIDNGAEWTATDLNDFLWFDDEIIAEILGYDNEDAMWQVFATRN